MLTLQETGILAQLKEVSANAVLAGTGPATAGWCRESRIAGRPGSAALRQHPG